jgi:hypothetical protein
MNLQFLLASRHILKEIKKIMSRSVLPGYDIVLWSDSANISEENTPSVLRVKVNHVWTVSQSTERTGSFAIFMYLGSSKTGTLFYA